MAYVASIIAVWIVIAVLFGFAVGWLARGRTGGAGKKSKKKKVRFR